MEITGYNRKSVDWLEILKNISSRMLRCAKSVQKVLKRPLLTIPRQEYVLARNVDGKLEEVKIILDDLKNLRITATGKIAKLQI